MAAKRTATPQRMMCTGCLSRFQTPTTHCTTLQDGHVVAPEQATQRQMRWGHYDTFRKYSKKNDANFLDASFTVRSMRRAMGWHGAHLFGVGLSTACNA
jgi:hypothetical protein